jgi:hypothetical protein
MFSKGATPTTAPYRRGGATPGGSRSLIYPHQISKKGIEYSEKAQRLHLRLIGAVSLGAPPCKSAHPRDKRGSVPPGGSRSLIYPHQISKKGIEFSEKAQRLHLRLTGAVSPGVPPRWSAHPGDGWRGRVALISFLMR